MKCMIPNGKDIRMSTKDKLIKAIVFGSSKNVKFRDLRQFMTGVCGMRERVRGDHFIYTKAGISDRIVLQPNGDMAKPYQVEQVAEFFLHYGGTLWGK